jgi:hypothetical protein
MSLLWVVLTLPLSQVIATGISNLWFDGDMTSTVTFFQVLIQVFPLLVAFSILAWGWVKTVEERETGVSTV